MNKMNKGSKEFVDMYLMVYDDLKEEIENKDLENLFKFIKLLSSKELLSKSVFKDLCDYSPNAKYAWDLLYDFVLSVNKD